MNPSVQPLIVACLRISDPRPDVDPITGEVSRDPRAAPLSANDAAALERALQLAEVWHGQVLAVAAGGPAADATLREVAALGARTLRVPWSAPDEHHVLGGAQDYLTELVDDERALAAVLAASIRGVGSPTLVLCGDRSADRGTGALPAFLAHELDAAQALGLVSLEPDPQGVYTLRAERRLDGGRREVLRVPSPAVCSVEAAGVRLRRASLSAALAAGDTEIPVAPAPPAAHSYDRERLRHDGGRPYRPRTRVVAPPAGAVPRDRLLDLTGALVVHDPPALVGPIDAAGAADALLDYLTRHGYRAE